MSSTEDIGSYFLLFDDFLCYFSSLCSIFLTWNEKLTISTHLISWAGAGSIQSCLTFLKCLKVTVSAKSGAAVTLWSLLNLSPHLWNRNIQHIAPSNFNCCWPQGRLICTPKKRLVLVTQECTFPLGMHHRLSLHPRTHSLHTPFISTHNCMSIWDQHSYFTGLRLAGLKHASFSPLQPQVTTLLSSEPTAI